ncbi:hypothetical protein NUW58_g2263 [Xylaria curta]|uniref:Uncharacterized protein n=1 Tax=Xylaria curta TaxID=42375 RepID=A0ACC1PI14_9PEZI|nr:hypothetical protein NUW58_g2263 [Xylaria curta]
MGSVVHRQTDTTRVYVDQTLVRRSKRSSRAMLHYDQGLPGRITPEFVSSDKMHPTFEGWEMMAEIYKRDILDVDAKGWIVAPVKNGIMDDGDAERDLEDAGMAKEKVNAGNGTTTHARGLRRGHVFW